MHDLVFPTEVVGVTGGHSSSFHHAQHAYNENIRLETWTDRLSLSLYLQVSSWLKKLDSAARTLVRRLVRKTMRLAHCTQIAPYLAFLTLKAVKPALGGLLPLTKRLLGPGSLPLNGYG